MENRDDEAIVSFDAFCTNNRIQILKILLPYFERPAQNRLAVLIKYLELTHTLRRLQTVPGSEPFPQSGQDFDISSVYSRIRRFCSPAQQAMFERLSSMKQAMEQYDEVMQMMQTFSDLMPRDAQDGGPAQGAEFWAGMLSPEQRALFEAFAAPDSPGT